MFVQSSVSITAEQLSFLHSKVNLKEAQAVNWHYNLYQHHYETSYSHCEPLHQHVSVILQIVCTTPKLTQDQSVFFSFRWVHWLLGSNQLYKSHRWVSVLSAALNTTPSSSVCYSSGQQSHRNMRALHGWIPAQHLWPRFWGSVPC